MPAIWAKRFRYIEELSAGAVEEGATRDAGTRRCLYDLYGLPIVFQLRLLVDRRFAADDGHNFVQQGKFFRSFCQDFCLIFKALEESVAADKLLFIHS